MSDKAKKGSALIIAVIVLWILILGGSATMLVGTKVGTTFDGVSTHVHTP